MLNLGNSNVFLTITSSSEAYIYVTNLIYLRVKQAKLENKVDFEKKYSSKSIKV
jgi:hypothetical protein